jgi:transcriptional regulator with XRE-family HTH domain
MALLEIDPESVSSFGSFVRSRRRELDLSLQEAAQTLGVSFAHLAKIERSEVQPSDSFLEKFGDLLRLRLREFRDPEEIQILGRTGPHKFTLYTIGKTKRRLTLCEELVKAASKLSDEDMQKVIEFARQGAAPRRRKRSAKK